MTPPDPGRVLRRALIGWGLGHLAIGRAAIGRALLVAELLGVALVAWLTVGLVASSAYLVPYLAGIGFLVAWAWQAVAAYRAARALQAARPPTPERSPAAAIGWLSLPLLAWGAGFWLVGGQAATPAATLDRFVGAWTSGALGAEWPDAVLDAAAAAEERLGDGPDRYRDVRFEVVEQDDAQALVVGEAVHYERRPTSLLGIFPGSELVPVADRRLLTLELEARPVELAGAGAIGAVRWELVDARR